MRRYIKKEIEASPIGLGMHGVWKKTGKITIVPDQMGVADHLAQQLAAYGVAAEINDEVSDEAGGVIYLPSLDRCVNEFEAMEKNKQAFQTARRIARRYEKDGGLFVTVQRTGGDFGLRGDSDLDAWQSGLRGLTNTMGLEWPQATVKSIDLDGSLQDAGECAKRIAEEILFGGPEQEVGLYANGKRTIQVHVEADEASLAATSFLPDIDRPVIVVSGGGRGVTAAATIRLAQERPCRFALLGRTLPAEEPPCCSGLTDTGDMQRALIEDDRAQGIKRTPAEMNSRIRQILAAREIEHTIKTLKQLGSEVTYVPVDVRDARQVREELDDVRASWGAIDAIVHGSGVLADKRIVDKTEAQFELVFETKVKGLHSLLTATKDDDLKAIVVFSSIVSESGNEGQADYAMANEVLNKVATMEAKRRGDQCVVRSIKWGPIDGGMVDSRIKKVFSKKNLPLITLDEAAECFLRELKTDQADEVEVLVCYGSPVQPQWGMMKKSEWSAEVQLHERFQPYLLDHQVRETVVLPVVQVLEWFVRLAKAVVPTLPVHQICDVNVKKGVLLPNFQGDGHILSVQCRPIPGDADADPITHLAMELISEQGTVHYTAAVRLGEPPNTSDITADGWRGSDSVAKGPEHVHRCVAATRDELVERWNWNEDAVYDGDLLFHGPAFQVIKEAGGMTPHSVAARLKSTLATHWDPWPAVGWHTVPDLLDGGMQIGRLWAIQYHDLPFLPMRIGRFVMYRPMTDIDELMCVSKCDTVGKLAAKGDIYFYNLSGQLVAEMSGVEGFRVL